jgi:hypothetical protein
MASGIRPIIENTFLIVLFGFFMIYFAYAFILNNNPSSAALDQLQNATLGFNDTINTFTNQANDTQNALMNAKPSPTGFLFLIFEQAFYIPRTFMTLIAGTLKTIATVIFPLAGGSGMGMILTILLMAMTFGLVISIVFAIIKNIRTGEQER